MSQLEGEIHDTETIVLLKWDNSSFIPYSRSVMSRGCGGKAKWDVVVGGREATW